MGGGKMYEGVWEFICMRCMRCMRVYEGVLFNISNYLILYRIGTTYSDPSPCLGHWFCTTEFWLPSKSLSTISTRDPFYLPAPPPPRSDQPPPPMSEKQAAGQTVEGSTQVATFPAGSHLQGQTHLLDYTLFWVYFISCRWTWIEKNAKQKMNL